MGFTEALKKTVGKRDKREKEIKSLLEKAIEEWPKNGFDGKDYLKKAGLLKEEIERERGIAYFQKYPEIPEMISQTIDKIDKFLEYES